MNVNAVVIPTRDALERDLRTVDAAIEQARRRGGGAWPIAREAERRLLALAEDVRAHVGGETHGQGWPPPSWARRSRHLFSSRRAAQEVAERTLTELRGFMANGGVPPFGAVSLALCDVMECDHPAGLSWAPDETLLLAERAAVAAELKRLYGPAEPEPVAVEQLAAAG